MQVLVNALQNSHGGGLVLLHNFLSYLSSANLHDMYVCLVPNEQAFGKYECNNVKVKSLPRYLKRNYLYPLVNRFILSKLIRKYTATVVFNFSDTPIPTATCIQVFVFDWPYAAYPNSPVWKMMDAKSYLIRRTKLYYFKKYFKYIDHLICQSNEMKHCLEKYYNVGKVDIIPPTFPREHFLQDVESNAKALFPTDYTLFYPAVYYPHKNVEILLSVAKLIKDRKLHIKIVITVEESQHPNVRKLLYEISSAKVDNIIINLGELDFSTVSHVFRQCNAMLMPTLLESFSISYVEAMFHQRPIFTSNLAFARAVCGDAAFYFDPHNPVDILDKIVQAKDNTTLLQKKVEAGIRIIESIPTVDEIQKQFINIIESYTVTENRRTF